MAHYLQPLVAAFRHGAMRNVGCVAIVQPAELLPPWLSWLPGILDAFDSFPGVAAQRALGLSSSLVPVLRNRG